MDVVAATISLLGWLGVGFLTHRSNLVLRELIEARLGKLEKVVSEIQSLENSDLNRIFSLERQFLEFKAEISQNYVAREDWIRFAAALDAKLDRLNERVEALRVNRL